LREVNKAQFLEHVRGGGGDTYMHTYVHTHIHTHVIRT